MCIPMQSNINEKVCSVSQSKINLDYFFFQNSTSLENIHDSLAGVTNTTSAFLTTGWPTQHQACWHQMGFTFLKGERVFLLRSLGGSLAGL